MLTELHDGTKEKCATYWPKKLNQTEVWKSSSGKNDIEVQLLEEVAHKSHDGRTIFYSRRIKISTSRDPNNFQIVTQTHYLAWPDHGVPDVTDDFLMLVEYIMKLRDNVDAKSKKQLPVCVHCR